MRRTRESVGAKQGRVLWGSRKGEGRGSDSKGREKDGKGRIDAVSGSKGSSREEQSRYELVEGKIGGGLGRTS